MRYPVFRKNQVLREAEAFVRKWLGPLGLRDWSVSVRWVAARELALGSDDHLAEVRFDVPSTIARISINPSRRWAVGGLDPGESDDLEAVILHELLHILFWVDGVIDRHMGLHYQIERLIDRMTYVLLYDRVRERGETQDETTV